MNYFMTAIGTDCGKTLASAIFCEALEADYWKPVQAGMPRDTDTVAQLIANKKTYLHPEQFLLKLPMSPHAAAKAEGVNIDLRSFRLPKTKNTLVIEGAGGCLVPLNDNNLVVDLMAYLATEVVIISNHYLGSINHTLLTVEVLKNRNIPIKGLVFNGDTNEESERIILHHTGLRVLLRIRREPVIDQRVIKKYASILKTELNG